MAGMWNQKATKIVIGRPLCYITEDACMNSWDRDMKINYVINNIRMMHTVILNGGGHFVVFSRVFSYKLCECGVGG